MGIAKANEREASARIFGARLRATAFTIHAARLLSLPLLASAALTSAAPARSEVISYAVLGDAGVAENPRLEVIRNSLVSQGIKHLILAGDNLYFPDKYTYPMVWDRWMQTGFSFDLVAIGNHNAGYDQEMKYFKMP